MIFSYHPNAGAKTLNIDKELFNHLIKARRQRCGDKLLVSKLDNYKHHYQIQKISARIAQLKLLKTTKITNKPLSSLHLGWCVIGSSVIKQTLPALNQLGLTKLTFIYGKRSQKSTKISLAKLHKILINSCCQCGRYDLMQLDICPTIADFLITNPKTILLNLGAKPLSQHKRKITTILVGPEGGFTNNEVKLFDKKNIVSLPVTFSLKSETAAIAITSNLLFR